MPFLFSERRRRGESAPYPQAEMTCWSATRLVSDNKAIADFCSPAVICALRLGEVSVQDDTILIRQPGCAPVKGGAAEILQRYLERLAELGLDCSLAAPLIVDLEGEALSVERLLVHYETARTIRVAMEANGSFCRALLSLHRLDAAGPSGHANTGGKDVQS